MASSSTSTTTLTEPQKVPVHNAAFYLHAPTASYKDATPVSYNKETEAKGVDGKGVDGHKGAKKYPDLLPFEHTDHGLDADPTFPNLLPAAARITHLTPLTGSEVHGVQLSQLTNAGKDELTRLVAERKVVAFRGQDFADLPIEKALEFGAYFGPLKIHVTSGSPEGFPDIHLVHRAAGDRSFEHFFDARTTSVAWHSDVSFEAQPPGMTLLYILDGPESGGDTLFSNTVEAYNRLSPLFKERLHGLQAVHSALEQVAVSVRKSSIGRREPVTNTHPIVRTHPVTGEKALFVNPQFTREIVGLKKEESDALLKFLFEHVGWGADFQARIKWEEGTVIVADNRVSQHTALIDWSNGSRRHLACLTPQAERPFETPFKA